MNPRIQVIHKTGNGGVKGLKERLEQLCKTEVYVGITQSHSSRPGKVTNAELMYIHTNGSPLRGIPARPVIQPAVQADGNKQAIAGELKEAAKQTLRGNPDEAMDALHRAGVAGTSAAKVWFDDPRNNWAPNRPSTIRRKKSQRPLIDTGTLRREIRHIIGERQ